MEIKKTNTKWKKSCSKNFNFIQNEQFDSNFTTP